MLKAPGTPAFFPRVAALQIVNRLLPIVGDLNGICYRRLVHGPLHKADIVRVVFDMEDRFHRLILFLVESKS